VNARLDPPRRSAGGWIGVAVAWVVAAAAVVVTVFAWGEPLPDLTAEDARQFSANAFEAAGFTEGAVRPDVEEATYREDDGPAFDVWITITDLEGQPVELWIDRERSQAVQIDDNTDQGPLLTDDQFQTLDRYEEHPGADERRRRNWLVTGAATLAVAVAAGALWFTGRRKPAPLPPATRSDPLEPLEPTEP
jgi:hypothetical protein